MVNGLKSLKTKLKWVIIFYNIFKNLETKLKFKLGKYETFKDSVIDNLSLIDSISYVNRVFEEYLQYSPITLDTLNNKRILEIGPGDNFGVALEFLAKGASRVVCLDKFHVMSSFKKRYRLYKALKEQLDIHSKKLFDESINLDKGIVINPNKLKYLYGIGITEAGELFKSEYFDLIVSRAVLEHIYDISCAFSVMDKLLAPGGYMLHKIDFRDHGMFSKLGMHPLTFLTIPEKIYQLMTKYSSKPNRKLINYYIHKMKELGYDFKFYVTAIFGLKNEFLPHIPIEEFNIDLYRNELGLIKEIRPKLRNKFKILPNDYLIISGIFLIAKKR